jgi:hypothetical protein
VTAEPGSSLRQEIRHTVKRGIRRAHEALGDQPLFLPLQLRLTPESAQDRAITADTELVIEGFPRSGNTFAAIAFAQSQPRPTRAVSHVHIPAQVKLAVRRGVPTLLLVREPEDAVVSMTIADPHHRVERLLRYWIHYHEELLPCRDQVLVASFEEVTTDFGAVVSRLNDRFGTSFTPFVHDQTHVDEVFAAVDEKQRRVHGERLYHEAVARPDPSRAAPREVLRRRLEAPEVAPWRERAHRVLGAMVEGGS